MYQLPQRIEELCIRARELENSVNPLGDRDYNRSITSEIPAVRREIANAAGAACRELQHSGYSRIEAEQSVCRLINEFRDSLREPESIKSIISEANKANLPLSQIDLSLLDFIKRVTQDLAVAKPSIAARSILTKFECRLFLDANNSPTIGYCSEIGLCTSVSMASLVDGRNLHSHRSRIFLPPLEHLASYFQFRRIVGLTDDTEFQRHSAHIYFCFAGTDGKALDEAQLCGDFPTLLNQSLRLHWHDALLFLEGFSYTPATGTKSPCSAHYEIRGPLPDLDGSNKGLPCHPMIFVQALLAAAVNTAATACLQPRLSNFLCDQVEQLADPADSNLEDLLGRWSDTSILRLPCSFGSPLTDRIQESLEVLYRAHDFEIDDL